jgi:uncharacterized protein
MIRVPARPGIVVKSSPEALDYEVRAVPDPARIGLISDTHGLLRPEAVEALRGVQMILHAGDVGKPEILEALGRLAPVRAVRGNNDRGEWAEALPETDIIEAGGVRIYVLHALQDLSVDPAAAGLDVIVAGHSHRPSVERSGQVLYVNPGSAGPRRFRQPVGVAVLEIRDGAVEARLFELVSGGA